MTTVEPPGFGVRLRRLREAAGLTQEELAERAGLTAKGIAALERGRRQRPYAHTIRALATALGLSEAERVALVGSVSPAATVPNGAGAAPPVAPPLPPTPTIGREREIAHVGELLRGGAARLVTLTGPGGVGKTRLAYDIARRAGAAFADGVGVVALAAVGDQALVLPAISQALRLTEVAGQPAPVLLRAYLAERRLLLVLDNVEHLLGVAPEIADLLATCPGLSLLVTSRAPLRIRGEREFPVGPLALPDLSHVPSREEVAAADAVQLFVERAQASVPSFVLTQANAAAVAAICRRLDGLPLALELAASRLRLVSPTELLARLDRALPLLSGGARDLPERQRTVRRTIDWSYDLLSAAEQTLFRRLAVFAGGWDLAAAEAVAGPGEWETGNSADGSPFLPVLDGLTGLMEHSLVVAATPDDGITRYRMLETIREYGQERLATDGDEDTAVRERHAAYYLALAEAAEQALIGAEQGRWLQRLDREEGNCRAALTWSLARPDPALITDLRLASALWRFWSIRGRPSEGRDWLTRALVARTAASDAVRATALNSLGNLVLELGDLAGARRLYEESLALYRALDHQEGVADELNNLGLVAVFQSDVGSARALLEESLAIRRAMDDRLGLPTILSNLGDIALAEEDNDRALELHAEALAIRRAIGNTRGVIFSCHKLGIVAYHRGDDDGAERWLAESLSLAESLGDRGGRASAVEALGWVTARRGRIGEAAGMVAEALTIWQELGSRRSIAESLEGLAYVATPTPRHGAAVRLLGAAAALRRELGVVVPLAQLTAHRTAMAALRHGLGEADFAAAFAAGERLTLEQAIAEAGRLAADLRCGGERTEDRGERIEDRG